MSTTVWYGIAVLLMGAGLVGTVLPALPGAPLLFAGMWLAAWAGGYERVGAFTLTVLGALALVTLAVDWVSSAWGTRWVGASRWAFAGAAAGTVFGLFLGLPGLLLGPFLGALLAEWAFRRDLPQAATAGFGAGLGFVAGSVVKISLAFAMLGIFFLALLL